MYYPGIRWEYKRVHELLKAGTREQELKILDVGCGKGDFLRGVDFIPNDKKFALDLNAPAIEECRLLGFQALCGTMETALAAEFLKPEEFPVVTSFHCLEHVEDPVEFIRSLIKVTRPGGRVLVSTPYSPMSFESDWFDILNHPPHHMTRWNLRAYQRLAEMVGAKMRYHVPPSSAVRRAVGQFRHFLYEPNQLVSKPRLVRDLLRHFPTFVRLYKHQCQRGRNNYGIAADVILVELTVS